MLTANEVFAINEVGDIKNGKKLFEKYGKLSKIRKLSKSLKVLVQTVKVYQF